MRATSWRSVAIALCVSVAAAVHAAPAEKTIAGDAVVPDRDKAPAAAKGIEHMKDVLKRMLVLLEEARNAKDVVKLNCVNEKLTQVKGLVRISEQAEIAMQEAISQQDSEISNHEFTKITLAGQRSEQLRSDTESCVGELAVYTGETVVVVEGDKGGDDPTHLPAPELIATRPPAASPYE